MSIITQDYWLHQIVKLHDPAKTAGRFNLGIDYILHFGGWNEETLAKLQALKHNLDDFAEKLKTARNKILSHNDLETMLNGSSHGTFAEGDDVKYFKSLQEFVNVVYDATVGGPNLFSEDAAKDAVIVSQFLANSLPSLKDK